MSDKKGASRNGNVVRSRGQSVDRVHHATTNDCLAGKRNSVNCVVPATGNVRNVDMIVAEGNAVSRRNAQNCGRVGEVCHVEERDRSGPGLGGNL